MADEILDDFKKESKSLIDQMNEILEKVEGDFGKVKEIEEYGQLVDRIMGGAKSLAMAYEEDHPIHKIGGYTEICKIVGYKTAQIKNNPGFYDICVGFLLDATEVLEDMNESLDTEEEGKINANLSETFIDRLKWLAEQFDESFRASVAVDSGEGTPQEKADNAQAEIDNLLKQLGVT